MALVPLRIVSSILTRSICTSINLPDDDLRYNDGTEILATTISEN